MVLMSRISLALAATIILLSLSGLVFASPAHAASSINVPLDDWSYDALDKLSGFGLLNSDMTGSKPYTRLETARLVLEAIYEKEKNPKVTNSPNSPSTSSSDFRRNIRTNWHSWAGGMGTPEETFLSHSTR